MRSKLQIGDVVKPWEPGSGDAEFVVGEDDGKLVLYHTDDSVNSGVYSEPLEDEFTEDLKDKDGFEGMDLVEVKRDGVIIWTGNH